MVGGIWSSSSVDVANLHMVQQIPPTKPWWEILNGSFRINL